MTLTELQLENRPEVHILLHSTIICPTPHPGACSCWLKYFINNVKIFFNWSSSLQHNKKIVYYSLTKTDIKLNVTKTLRQVDLLLTNRSKFFIVSKYVYQLMFLNMWGKQILLTWICMWSPCIFEFVWYRTGMRWGWDMDDMGLIQGWERD